eukprot:1825217-Pyramimonas_sp.AAC.1
MSGARHGLKALTLARATRAPCKGKSRPVPCKKQLHRRMYHHPLARAAPLPATSHTNSPLTLAVVGAPNLGLLKR